jgi:hypothetical protein
MSQIGAFIPSAVLSAILEITPDAGIVVVPDGSGNVDVNGGANINTFGDPNQLIINLNDDVVTNSYETSDVAENIHIEANQIVLGGTNPDVDLDITPQGAGNVNILSGTLSIASFGLGSVLSDANGDLSSVNGTDGQLLIGGTGLIPTWGSLTSTGGTIAITPGANTLNIDVDAEVATEFDGDTGTAIPALNVLTIAGGTSIVTAAAGSTVTINADVDIANTYTADTGSAVPALNNINILGGTNIATTGAGSTVTIDFDGTLPVASGGTGNTTFTAYSVICAGTAATNPFQNVSGLGTAGQVLTSTGAGALPTWQDNSSFAWNEITGTSSGMLVNNGYIANNAGVVTLTLPATAARGSILEVVGKGTGGWSIAQNAGQTIHYISVNTTTGAGGSLSSTAQYDAIKLVCITADTDFAVLSSAGNITYV